MTPQDYAGVSRKHRWRWAIFGMALLVRLWFGAISFGSVDLTRSLLSTQDLLAGELWSGIPYLPTMSIFITLGGVLALKTPLPLALCYKLYPILFDSLMAVLVHDVVDRRSSGQARTAGLLYAFSPVSILVTCFHAQWDAIWLFFALLAFYVREEFAESLAKHLLFGVFFGVALLCKPVVLLLAPLFVSAETFCNRSWQRASGAMTAVAGFSGVALLALIGFHLAGYSLFARLNAIVDYSAGGVIIFGLPFAFPFDHFPLLRERACLLVILMAVVIPYMRGQIDSYSSILAMYCGALGVSGLCPQYLFWPVPLLLMTGHWRSGAVYQVMASVFLLFYYLNPFASYFPFENMATLALLRPLSWAMPPAGWMGQVAAPLIGVLGNYALPVFFLALVLSILSRVSRRPVPDASCRDNGALPLLARLGSVYVPVLLCIGSSILFLRFLVYSPSFSALFSREFVEQQAGMQYQVEFWIPDKVFVGQYPATSSLHLGWGILLGVCAWAIAAPLAARAWRPLARNENGTVEAWPMNGHPALHEQ